MYFDQEKKGILITMLSAAGFGAMPILAQYAYRYGANVTTLLFVRFSLASIIFLLYLIVSKKNYQISRSDIIKLIAVGAAGYGLLSSLYFFGVSLIPASLSGFLLYSYPALVTIFAFLNKEEKLYRENVIALGMAGAGLALILGPVFRDVNLLGVGSVLLAAVAYASYILVSNRILKRVNWLPGSTIVTISAAFFFLLSGVVRGNLMLAGLHPQVLMAGIGLAIFSTVLAVAGFYLGISMIGPSRASIVSTVEPLVTVILAAIFFAERLTLIQLAGGLFILISIVMLQGGKYKSRKNFDKPS
ncbi:MAG: DMT family transporter [Bacillota bacterium]